MSQPQARVLLSLPGEGEFLDPSGSLVLRVRSRETGGACSVLELSLGPGQGAALHVHRREDEIFCVLSGECEVSDLHGPRTALPGSVAVFARGMPHAFRNTSAQPCRVLITAVPGGLEHFFIAINEAIAAGVATPQRLAAIAAEFEIHFLPAAAPPAPA